MSDAVIVALITGAIALLGNIITNSATSKLMAYKIEELKNDMTLLSDRVNKHNNLVERMAIVEQSAKSAHHRLDELKSDH